MEKFKNRMFEIGNLLEQSRAEEFVTSIGHRVYEISLLLNNYREDCKD